MNTQNTTIPLFFSEAALNLARAGFAVERIAPERLAVNMEGSLLCEVTSVGGVTYLQGDVATPERRAAKDAACEIVGVTAEYSRLMAHAPPLAARDLGEGYKLLADFNGTVLAGKETPRGVKFVTWDWDFNRAGLNHGHYYEDYYEGAKRDFAVRSGLVDRGRVFSDEQLVGIYRCCEEALANGIELGHEQKRHIRDVVEQIRSHIPDINTIIQEQNEQREEVQHEHITE